MIVRCDSQYFFQRGLAFERLVNASHPQSLHPFSNSLVLDHRRRCSLHNQAADGFGYRQRFDDCQPSEITATLATIATAPAVKNGLGLRFNSEPRENLWLGHKFLTAVCANLTHQTLRARHQNRARNQERLDPHVVQTRDRAGGVIGMQSGKHLVTGQRRFHRDIGGLVVANFTHHYDVGVLPQDRAQGRGKVQPDVVAHRNLIDSVELVLDRVGPVTRIIPCGASIAFLNFTSVSSSNPIWSIEPVNALLSKIRITTFSPCEVGRTETRRSTSLPITLTRKRPSCGTRRSAMFRPAKILMREVIASCSAFGGDSAGAKSPSTR